MFRGPRRLRVRLGWLILGFLGLMGAAIGSSFRTGVCTDYVEGPGECTTTSPLWPVVIGLAVALVGFFRAFTWESRDS